MESLKIKSKRAIFTIYQFGQQLPFFTIKACDIGVLISRALATDQVQRAEALEYLSLEFSPIWYDVS